MNQEAGRPTAGWLDGFRVLDVGPRIASAYAAKHLGELGADVVRIETPEPDALRRMPPFVGDPEEECGAVHLFLNASKRSIAFKYTLPAGRELLARLLAEADIIINGHSPEESEALGLTTAVVALLSPSAVLVDVSTFGHTGPYRDFAGSDIIALAMGGIMYMTGDTDAEPLAAFGHQAEYVLGVNAAIASLVALYGRETGGPTQSADVSGMETCATMLENAVGLHMVDGFVRRRYGNGIYSKTPTVDVYACKDGFVSMSLPLETHWVSLCTILDRLDWLDDPALADWPGRERRSDEISAAIGAWCKERTRQEIFELCQLHRMPVAPGHTLGDVLDDPQHAARGYLLEVNQPCVGEMKLPRLPFLSNVCQSREERAPLLGEHTYEVLSEWLNLTTAELQALRQTTVLWAESPGVAQ